MDERIPLKWRLKQTYLDKSNPPCEFPVFLKPESGGKTPMASKGLIQRMNF